MFYKTLHVDEKMNLEIEIQIEEDIHSDWQVWFDGFILSREIDGTTLLQGSVSDQAALYGLLMRINQLGLTLLRVEQFKRSEAE